MFQTGDELTLSVNQASKGKADHQTVGYALASSSQKMDTTDKAAAFHIPDTAYGTRRDTLKDSPQKKKPEFASRGVLTAT